MALHLEVRGTGRTLAIVGEWETGKEFPIEYLSRGDNGIDTAAEVVEFYLMTEYNLVASWHWSKSGSENFPVLHGQFVHAASHGGKAMKEVNYSLADKFDL